MKRSCFALSILMASLSGSLLWVDAARSNNGAPPAVAVNAREATPRPPVVDEECRCAEEGECEARFALEEADDFNCCEGACPYEACPYGNCFYDACSDLDAHLAHPADLPESNLTEASAEVVSVEEQKDAATTEMDPRNLSHYDDVYDAEVYGVNETAAAKAIPTDEAASCEELFEEAYKDPYTGAFGDENYDYEACDEGLFKKHYAAEASDLEQEMTEESAEEAVETAAAKDADASRAYDYGYDYGYEYDYGYDYDYDYEAVNENVDSAEVAEATAEEAETVKAEGIEESIAQESAAKESGDEETDADLYGYEYEYEYEYDYEAPESAPAERTVQEGVAEGYEYSYEYEYDYEYNYDYGYDYDYTPAEQSDADAASNEAEFDVLGYPRTENAEAPPAAPEADLVESDEPAPAKSIQFGVVAAHMRDLLENSLNRCEPIRAALDAGCKIVTWSSGVDVSLAIGAATAELADLPPGDEAPLRR